MKGKFIIYFIFFLLVVSHQVQAQESNLFGKVSLGIEMGTWKPNNLENDPSFSPFRTSKATPYVGVFFLSPWKSNFTLRVSLGFWNYEKQNNTFNLKSVTLLPLLLDLKYVLVPEFRLSPYVSYGMAMYFAYEDGSRDITKLTHRRTEVGYGGNVGAGFDILIARHWALGVEFRYHYARFRKVLGWTKDYSGPKITFALYYLF